MMQAPCMKTMPRGDSSLIRTQRYIHLFKKAIVGSLARPIDFDQRPDRNYHRPLISSRSFPFRFLSTARPVVDSRQSLYKKSQIAERGLSDLEYKVNKILRNPAIPSEQSVQSSLENCEACARSIAQAKKASDSPLKVDGSPASTLLSLEERQEDPRPLFSMDAKLAPSLKDKIAKQVSKIAYNIMADPKVFITAAMLGSFVRTQSLLGFPETIPQVFVLYASKPIPRPDGTSIRYISPSPNKASSAIPLVTVHAGLGVAIEARNLPVCFDIINTSVGTSAFRRSKFIRRALLPLTAFALSPIAAYVLASKLSVYQITMDQSTSTNITFAGVTAYIFFTGIIGMVAVTTANDQMDRITWAPGTPLRERWLREEERATIDRVAQAWGFQNRLRRGEEEGRDWEMLREWVGLRSMELDRVELMEGME